MVALIPSIELIISSGSEPINPYFTNDNNIEIPMSLPIDNTTFILNHPNHVFNKAMVFLYDSNNSTFPSKPWNALHIIDSTDRAYSNTTNLINKSDSIFSHLGPQFFKNCDADKNLISIAKDKNNTDYSYCHEGTKTQLLEFSTNSVILDFLSAPNKIDNEYKIIFKANESNQPQGMILGNIKVLPCDDNDDSKYNFLQIKHFDNFEWDGATWDIIKTQNCPTTFGADGRPDVKIDFAYPDNSPGADGPIFKIINPEYVTLPDINPNKSGNFNGLLSNKNSPCQKCLLFEIPSSAVIKISDIHNGSPNTIMVNENSNIQLIDNILQYWNGMSFVNFNNYQNVGTKVFSGCDSFIIKACPKFPNIDMIVSNIIFPAHFSFQNISGIEPGGDLTLSPNLSFKTPQCNTCLK